MNLNRKCLILLSPIVRMRLYRLQGGNANPRAIPVSIHFPSKLKIWLNLIGKHSFLLNPIIRLIGVNAKHRYKMLCFNRLSSKYFFNSINFHFFKFPLLAQCYKAFQVYFTLKNVFVFNFQIKIKFKFVLLFSRLSTS